MELLKPKGAAVVYAVGVALLVVGTFADVTVSTVLYTPGNPFGYVFQAFGELPCALVGWSAAALLMTAREQVPVTRRKRLTVAIVVAFLTGVISFFEVVYHLDGAVMKLVGLAIELAVSYGLFAWVRTHADRSDPERLVRVGMVMLLTCLVSFVVYQLVKIGWGRPRWRSIVDNDDLEFRPWYVMGKDLRDLFEDIIPHEEFKSFPSGHSADAACSLALVLLPDAVPAVKDKGRLIAACALAWTAIVMLSRIVAGAHFVTDVTAGFLVTYTVLFVLYHSYGRRMLGR